MTTNTVEGQAGGRTESIVAHVLLWALAAVVVLPLVLVVQKAVEPPDGSGGIDLGNFSRAWEQGGFGHSLTSSLIVTVSVVAATTVLSVLGGYAIGVLAPKGAGALTIVFVLGLIVPFEALIIPLFLTLRELELVNTRLALILPQSALSLSFGIYWMRSFFRGVPRSILEAARVEGASSWTTLTRVLLPMARPAILTLVILSFMWNWNEFLIPLVMIYDQNIATAPLSLALFQSRYSVDQTAQAAGALIIAIPILVVYAVLYRKVISGFAASSGARAANR